jgi:hypothetical protein
VVPHGSVLGSLLFLAYVHYIWRDTESTIKLLADDCIIRVYREIINSQDIEKLQIDLNRLGKWAVENEMKINPAKSKLVCFTRARVTKPLTIRYGAQKFRKTNNCKYLGIILRNDLS